MEINSRENNQNEESHDFAKYIKRQGDWLEKTRGNLMVAATVIAAMTFQVMVNPPGGVWQSDDCSLRNQTGLIPVSWNQTGNQTEIKPICKVKAGTSILQHDSSKRVAYLGMVISSTVSFSASMSIILLVISGLRLRNRLIMAILVAFMVVAVLFVSAAFFFAVALVQYEDEMILIILVIYFGFWVVFLVLVLISLLVQFLVWLIRCCCCRGQRRRRRSP